MPDGPEAGVAAIRAAITAAGTADVTELATATLADGSEDIDSAAADLAARMPAPLEPLARLAFNYRVVVVARRRRRLPDDRPGALGGEQPQPDPPAPRDDFGDARARGG